MSHALIAFVFAIGFAGWIYSLLSRQTGNGNQKSAIIGAGISGLLAFIVVFTLASMLFKN